MFARGQRLSRLDFTKLSDDRTASRLTSSHFSLVYSGSHSNGCSVVVSKKVAKGSVQRHLLKRRIREVLRPWCTKGAYIIYARTGSLELPFPALSSELSTLLQRVTT